MAPARSAEAPLYMPHHGPLPGGPGLQGISARPSSRARHAALILEGLLVEGQCCRPGARLLSRQNLHVQAPVNIPMVLGLSRHSVPCFL